MQERLPIALTSTIAIDEYNAYDGRLSSLAKSPTPALPSVVLSPNAFADGQARAPERRQRVNRVPLGPQAVQLRHSDVLFGGAQHLQERLDHEEARSRYPQEPPTGKSFQEAFWCCCLRYRTFFRLPSNGPPRPVRGCPPHLECNFGSRNVCQPLIQNLLRVAVRPNLCTGWSG